MEKGYNELSKSARKGLNKFTSLKSSKSMKEYGDKFNRKTGKNSYNVEYKEEFFEFVDKNKLRNRR